MSSIINLTSPIVSAKWLHNNINAKNLIILDGTINKVLDVTTQQIPNARLFEIKAKFSDLSNPFPSAFPSQDQFEKEARALGINTDSAIVVYDDKGIYSSARVWWLFKAFGYNNVAVLNGGFPEWLNQGFLTENMTSFTGELGNFKVHLQSGFMAFFSDMKQASKTESHTIIDARSSGRFNCEVPEPREGLRMGTIPNSVNLPFTDLLENGLLKEEASLKTLFSNKIPNKEVSILFSCGSGITACVLALGAEIAGYKNLTVYDGSWTEWGSLVEY